MLNEKFDAIVVGAGPAGISAAITLAKGGMKTLVLERGQYPGAKNVMGGIMYRNMLDKVMPGLSDEAPFERHISEQRYSLLGKDSATSVSHWNEKFNQKPYNCFTVLRAKFDRWYAKKATDAGAIVICETKVTSLILEKGKVVGVKTDRLDGDVFADVVIICDGANSLLAKKAGFLAEIKSNQMSLACKEILSLPAEKIQDRFCLEKDEGLSFELVGDNSAGMIGIGFLYTNKDSLSIGVGCLISEFVKTKISPYDLIDRMKNHPWLKKLIHGAELEEYMAHTIPEGGYDSIPKVYGNGYMICGNAAHLVNAVHREGSNLAMTSGRLAAETALQLHAENKEFNEKNLAAYHEALNNTFVLPDLKKYRRFPHFTENFKEIFQEYPEMINDAMYDLFLVDGVSKIEKQHRIISNFKKKVGTWRLLRTALAGWRAIQ